MVFLLPLLLPLLPTCLTSPTDDWLPTSTPGVLDFASNPILRPTELGEWILGDPSVLRIGEHLHMFCNEVVHGILHFTASPSSPTSFTRAGSAVALPGAVRPYALLEEDTLHLYYEQYELPLFHTSKLMLRSASVSISSSGEATFVWRPSQTILRPELSWEREGYARVGNPFVFHSPEFGDYRMYYSASSLHLADSNIEEPLYLGLASAPAASGPWSRLSSSPLTIEGEIEGQEVLTTSSLKLVKSASDLQAGPFALCNRITLEPLSKRTGSTISLLLPSRDGLGWQVRIPATATKFGVSDPHHQLVLAGGRSRAPSS